jgi:hypothetical protein
MGHLWNLMEIGRASAEIELRAGIELQAKIELIVRFTLLAHPTCGALVSERKRVSDG